MAEQEPQPKSAKKVVLRALGFCGADDSIDPALLVIYSQAYPLVEFGVLFRPDKEGTPRYASPGWVLRLGELCKKQNGKMKLAAHLCGTRVDDLLKGDDSFISSLSDLGFKRVQINATAVNGVDTSVLEESVATLLDVIVKHPELEFIIQKNDETKPLWLGILEQDDEKAGKRGYLPSNVSMLLDESKGTGVLPSSWPNPPDEYPIGYAGGIGPDNIKDVLHNIFDSASGRTIWIDMESRLRSTKDGADVFDITKCHEVVEAICLEGLMSQPSFLT